jgi:hypothetical protein
MKALKSFRLIAFAITLIGASAFAAQRSEIEAAYAKWSRLMMAQDWRGVRSMMAPIYYLVDLNGRQVPLGEVDASLRAFLTSSRGLRVRVAVRELHPSDVDECVAWVTITMEYQMQHNRMWVPMRQTINRVDTLRKTAAGWEFTYSQIVRQF